MEVDTKNAVALRTQGLTKAFGRLTIVENVDLVLPVGARHAMIGPNGAGKTTIINMLTGQLRPTSGRVMIAGHDVTDEPVHQRVKRGLARTFQINSLLPEMTVLEHVQLAVVERMSYGSHALGGARIQRETSAEAYAILESLNLAQAARLQITELSYGRQRLVEIAMALALKPAVLLLDEPAAGVPPADSHLVFGLIERLPENVSVLFIEHDMKLVARFAQRISVLVDGRIVVEGTPAEIASNSYVRDVYLGHRQHA